MVATRRSPRRLLLVAFSPRIVWLVAVVLISSVAVNVPVAVVPTVTTLFGDKVLFAVVAIVPLTTVVAPL
jgi:hypothetical protein